MDIREVTYAYYVKSKTAKSQVIPTHWNKSSIVEVGSGIDNYAAYLNESKYVAVDLDIKNANSKFPFVQGDINHLPFKDGSFDEFIALSIIEHVKDPLSPLKELHRICKSGGIVAVPCLDEFPFLYDPVNWIRKRKGKPIANFGIGGFGHVNVFYREEWKRIFKKAGFHIEKEESSPSLDVFMALEFFILSIFFSRNEYVHLMNKLNSPSSMKKVFIGILKSIKPAIEYIYRFLFSLNWKVKGKIGYCFYLEKI